MPTRLVTLAAWAMAALAISLPSSASSAGARRRPNVLLISLDDVRADFLTFRDPETSPHMTALAREGAIFTQAVSGSSWTLPAHVQMFTGTPPVLHRVQSDDVCMDPLTPTLPEVLKAAGYYTAGFFTNSYLSGFYGFDRGFDLYETPRGGGSAAAQEVPAEQDITSPQVVALAASALEGADPAQPVFLFAHFYDPHSDFIPPPPWNTKFDPDYTGDLDGRGYAWNKRIFDQDKTPGRQIGERDLEHIRSLYRGEIGWTDQHVGQLLNVLKRHRRLAQTLIVITSDHGEEFFEHQRNGHRKSLYEEVLRVPLLIVPPKNQRDGLSETVSQQVSLSDLLPTVLDFAGVATPPTAKGRSLRPAMYGATLTPRAELSSLHTWQRNEGRFRHWFIHGLRTATHKFIRLTGMGTDGIPWVEDFVYYDLARDPDERHGIRDPSDPRVSAAWRELEAELDEVRETWETTLRTQDDQRIIGVDFRRREELVALGYVNPNEERMQAPMTLLPSGLRPMLRIEPPESRIANGRALVLAAGATLGMALAALLAWKWRSRRGPRDTAQ